jgi:hypothetical protein
MFVCCIKSQPIGREVWIDFNKQLCSSFSSTPLKTHIYNDHPSLKDINTFIQNKGYGAKSILIAEIDQARGEIVCYRDMNIGIIPLEGPIILRISTTQLIPRNLH